MSLLNKIIIKNFKSFREKTIFDLSDGSYFVGANNSGKSTVLNAVLAFFDDSIFTDENFINKTSFLSKKAGSNTAEITICFNLEVLNTKIFKQSLVKKYSTFLSVSKIVSITTDTKIISYSYRLNDEPVDNLPDDVLRLIKSVKVTYLHPQDGQTLLVKAQEKLRQRLLANWGRNSNITNSIKKVQDGWDELRKQSKSYLSGSLTESLQKMWPSSEVTINLPKDIRDIIAVSDINFSGYENAPEMDLTSQGTGAQSTILYLTHFLLDSDRTLHRGEYHPLWLLEEPESFLHMDLLANLAKQLNSDKWLSNIQMVISTHSPVLLAGSRLAKDRINWSVLCGREVIFNKITTNYTDDEIKEIGKMMGDPNFFAYFLAAQDEPLIFTEDSKTITVEKYIKAGVGVRKGLSGVSEISKYLDVFLSAPFILNGAVYFIIDSDKGKEEFSRFYDKTKPDKKAGEFSRFKVKKSEKIYLIFLPSDFSAEDLFFEFNNHLEECINKIWNVDTWKIDKLIPPELSSVVTLCRRKEPSSKDEAINIIKNHDDVKSLFWEKVRKFDYGFDQKSINDLKKLLS